MIGYAPLNQARFASLYALRLDYPRLYRHRGTPRGLGYRDRHIGKCGTPIGEQTMWLEIGQTRSIKSSLLRFAMVLRGRKITVLL